MIELVTTVESIGQAEKLLPMVDTIVFGEETFGLRLPCSFTHNEQKELVALAHAAGKKAMVAVNGIMHPEKMKQVTAYLAFLNEIHVDKITLGDPGIIYEMHQQPDLALPFVYDSETLVTNARQMNCWGHKEAEGAVLAREVPFQEMKKIAPQLDIPVEVLLYGATCIHQSKRPLLENYYHFTQQEEKSEKARGLFLAEPKDKNSHYSILDDTHGTHIFANKDLCLINQLEELVENGFTTWKLDGIFSPGDHFVEITKLFDQARQDILAKNWKEEKAHSFFEKITKLHPKGRELTTGFYSLDPDDIK